MRLKRALLGEDPRALRLLLAPTALALALDVVLRGRVLVGYALQGKAIYGSSLLISAGFWVLPLWCIARLHGAALAGSTARRRLLARLGSIVLLGGWVLPLVTFSFGGQTLYHRVVHAYMGRDTVRLGFALRGTVSQWFAAWGSSLALVAMIASGMAITIGLGAAIRRVASRVSGRPPFLPVFGFVGAVFCMWIDMVDSRFLQAATPDDCFAHGFVHALRVGITGQGRTSHGISLRTPAPLPAIEAKGPRPNVLLIVTESVRADALCSESQPSCRSRFLDEAAPDRIALGKMTTPSSGTFGSCMVVWTGLPVTADVNAAHSAPVLWELARAVGYRTAYITSQNLQFENFGAYVQHAGIDVLESATELGGLKQEQLGAPDERATEAMLRVVRGVPAGAPYFGVLHLSNTHAPYRVDADLQPFTPHSDNPVGDGAAFHNHYRNSVLLQERTVSAFLRELRALPGWDDTVVLFVSDHGEQFRERGGLYHLHSLYEEEVRIPGFILGGARALGDARRSALRTFADHRTYLADVNATIVDLLGLWTAHDTLPFANRDARSLVDARGWPGEPVTLLSTGTAVWEQDDVRNGVMLGNRLLVGGPNRSWTCFDITDDPSETNPHGADRCGRRMREAAKVFGP
ncbi:MAG TPA: sulfatase-like hydrolase/transferase [Labilithrix sp.]|nr:sulfatase-like hydrolase/transferase [Labilithrix sp.]